MYISVRVYGCIGITCLCKGHHVSTGVCMYMDMSVSLPVLKRKQTKPLKTLYPASTRND